MLSDANAAWATSLGLQIDLTSKGFGIRTNRFAIIVDDLVIKYIEVRSSLVPERSFLLTCLKILSRPSCQLEPGPGVTVSGADTVLAKLEGQIKIAKSSV